MEVRHSTDKKIRTHGGIQMTYTQSDYGTRSLIWYELIVGLSIHYDKLYSYPSQQFLLRKAKEWKGLICSLRTLNRDLFRMAKEHWFSRKRRLTRKGVTAGRFTSTMYIIGKNAFKFAMKMKKVVNRLLSFSRLPNLANNKSQRENKILKEASGDVGILWKADIKGGLSPNLDPATT